MKTNSVMLWLLLLPVVACGQKITSSERSKLDEAENKLAKSDGRFNPAFFKDARHQHQVVEVSVANGIYTPVRRYTRPGKLPFLQEPAGIFQVTYRGANGKRIGSYGIDPPDEIRSCDVPVAGTRRLTGPFTFDVLLPNDPAIQQLDLASDKKTIASFVLPKPTPRPSKKP